MFVMQILVICLTKLEFSCVDTCRKGHIAVVCIAIIGNKTVTLQE